jgi:16S rRNA (guanine966-N2)-methyltransferase
MKPDQAANRLRIIAGVWRGRKLSFAPVPGLRPTPDRVRETLFNWLAPVLCGARCLDLYAGSGALGLEAASRGAERVLLVEQDVQVVSKLREQLQLLDAGQVQLIEADVVSFLHGEPQLFDIVFLDPPYRSNCLEACANTLETGGWLAEEAWIYMEAERELRELPLPDNWSVYRSKTAGQVGYHLARRIAAPSTVI